MSSRRSTSIAPIITIIFLLTICVALVLYIFSDKTNSVIPSPGQTDSTLQPNNRINTPTNINIHNTNPEDSEISSYTSSNDQIPTTPAETPQALANNGILDIKTTNKTIPSLTKKPTSNLSNLFKGLDEKEYIQQVLLTETSKERFKNILQRLIKSPPIIAGESDDLYNLLQNTAHFFRTLGGENIRLIKSIISNESSEIEIIAANIFTNVSNSESLEREFDIVNENSAIYEYGCFFLNTMGGRLYVFRRNTELRMIINYYALSVVAEAELNGLNNHGIDIRLHLQNLIKELEDYGQKLVFRDNYLQKLYSLEKDFQ